ncbi:UDP-N-acetylglucosamine 2-epimerase, partial [Elusimicrobiota bacterium]
QEEGAALRKPVLVARDVTERPELIEAGGGLLVGRKPLRIVREVKRLFRDGRRYRNMCRAKNPFGDGKAGERIASLIMRRPRA